MNARFLAEVEAEIRDAAQYYEDNRPGVADRFLDAILVAQRDIEDNPTRFPLLAGIRAPREIRRRLIEGFPYAMIYEVRATELLILAVAHGRRRPGYWKRRKR